MPDANLVRSIMYLFDCHCDDFQSEKYVESISDLEMRAEIEVIYFLQNSIFHTKIKN